LKYVDEKICVFLGAITYAEVVYRQTKGNVAGGVSDGRGRGC
jgi:hypothetical protein